MRTRDFCFQAEGGIRALTVTGVQTCALPICQAVVALAGLQRRVGELEPTEREVLDGCPRSAERRVGKVCRSRWSASLWLALNLRFTSIVFLSLLSRNYLRFPGYSFGW